MTNNYQFNLIIDDEFTFNSLNLDFKEFNELNSLNLGTLMLMLTHNLKIKDCEFCALRLAHDKIYQFDIFTLLMEIVLLSFFPCSNEGNYYFVNFLNQYDINIQFIDTFIDDEIEIILPILKQIDIKQIFIEMMKKKYNNTNIIINTHYDNTNIIINTHCDNIQINAYYDNIQINAYYEKIKKIFILNESKIIKLIQKNLTIYN